MGVSPISALVPVSISESCAAALDWLLIFPRDSHQLKQFCSFLGLFAPVHAQDVQIRSTAHMVLPAELLLLE